MAQSVNASPLGRFLSEYTKNPGATWHRHRIVGNYTQHSPLGDAIKFLLYGPGAKGREHALNWKRPRIVKAPDNSRPKTVNDRAFWHLTSVSPTQMPRQVAMAMGGAYARQRYKRGGQDAMLVANATQEIKSLHPLETQMLNRYDSYHRFYRVNQLY